MTTNRASTSTLPGDASLVGGGVGDGVSAGGGAVDGVVGGGGGGVAVTLLPSMPT